MKDRQFKEIGILLNTLELAKQKLFEYGVITVKEGIELEKITKNGWLKIHDFHDDLSDEERKRFHRLFPDKSAEQEETR